jgi:hypothetical protein
MLRARAASIARLAYILARVVSHSTEQNRNATITAVSRYPYVRDVTIATIVRMIDVIECLPPSQI